MLRRRILFAALLAALIGVVRPSAALAADYALVVGVQSYKHDNGFTQLHYTEEDARELKNTLERVGFDVRLLSTAADSPALPDKNTIKKAIDNVCSLASDPDSTLIVFLAGHGKSLQQGDDGQDPRAVFCPYDVQENPEKNTYENTLDITSEVVDVMKGSRAGRKFLFIDACRDLNKRGPGFKIPKNLKLKPPGVDVIFSCTTNELATERPELNHGVFSYYLIQALKFGTGRNGPQGLSISDLHSFLAEKVSSYVHDKVKDRQNPQNPDWIPKGPIKGSDIVASMKQIGSERTITCRVRDFEIPDDVPTKIDDITDKPDQSGTRRYPKVFRDFTFTGDFVGVNFSGAPSSSTAGSRNAGFVGARS